MKTLTSRNLKVNHSMKRAAKLTTMAMKPKKELIETFRKLE